MDEIQELLTIFRKHMKLCLSSHCLSYEKAAIPARDLVRWASYALEPLSA